MPEALHELRLREAATSWWRRHRPAGWTLEQHLEEPTVNARGSEGSFRLALAVADHVRAKLDEARAPEHGGGT